MSWNFRRFTTSEDSLDPQFWIGEAYYTDDGEIWACTQDAQSPYGETEEELANCYKMMQEAFLKPVIDLDTFVFAKPDWETTIPYGIPINEEFI